MEGGKKKGVLEADEGRKGKGKIARLKKKRENEDGLYNLRKHSRGNKEGENRFRGVFGRDKGNSKKLEKKK